MLSSNQYRSQILVFSVVLLVSAFPFIPLFSARVLAPFHLPLSITGTLFWAPSFLSHIAV